MVVWKCGVLVVRLIVLSSEVGRVVDRWIERCVYVLYTSAAPDSLPLGDRAVVIILSARRPDARARARSIICPPTLYLVDRDRSD
jgi:hypothetical protein